MNTSVKLKKYEQTNANKTIKNFQDCFFDPFSRTKVTTLTTQWGVFHQKPAKEPCFSALYTAKVRCYDMT